jgi:hypothetical protein
MTMTVFCDIVPCRFVEIYQCFYSHWPSGYRACRWTQGSWVQIQLGTMDF